MKLFVAAVLVACVVAAVTADDKPCLLACEPNNNPICVRDTKTKETQTMYNYCIMLQHNQCMGGSFEKVSDGDCPEEKSKNK